MRKSCCFLLINPRLLCYSAILTRINIGEKIKSLESRFVGVFKVYCRLRELIQIKENNSHWSFMYKKCNSGFYDTLRAIKIMFTS